MTKIALCGFMGCGKSTVAAVLSEKLGLVHIDTDKYIEDTSGMTIADIFSTHGEQYFRDKEHDAIRTLSQKDGCVLALGGGAVMHRRNTDTLKANGYVIVFIDTDINVIKLRLENDTTRPLLHTNDIDTLHSVRLPVYSAVCDVKISCKDEKAHIVADMITDSLKDRRH